MSAPTRVGDQTLLSRIAAAARRRGIDLEAPVPDDTPETRTAEQRERQAAHRRMVFEDHVPERFREASLDRLAPQQADVIRGWYRTTSPTLLLYGTVGNGKTYAAYAALRHALDRMEGDPEGYGLHRQVAAVNVPELLRGIRPGDSLPYWCRRAHVLLLDDLGLFAPQPWQVEFLYVLADVRSRHALRTIVTTNVEHPDALTALYGPQFVSRLLPARATTPLLFRGTDRREDW